MKPVTIQSQESGNVPEAPIVTRVFAPEMVTDPLLDRFDLGYLWRTYWRRFLLLPLLGAGIGLGVALIKEPLFESSALLLIDPGYEKTIRYEAEGGAQRSELESLKSMEVAIATDSVLSRVLDRLDLRAEERFLPERLRGAEVPEPKILKFLRDERVSTSLVPETRLIRIRVLDPMPERAKRFAEALSEEFETYLGEQRRKEIERARGALEVQALQARGVALESDRRLDEFRGSNSQHPVEQDHELSSARLSQIGEQLNVATGLRLQLESQKEALEALEPDNAALEIIKVAGYNDMAHVSALLGSLSAAKAELSGVEEQFTEQHPTRRGLMARVKRGEAELRELAASIKAAVGASYLAEKSREEGLARELELAKGQFAEMKSLSSEFRALQQQAERDWTVHQTLQGKLSESAVAIELTGQIATMVSEPMLPYKKATPVTPLFVIVGGALGGGLALGGVLLAVFSGLPYSSSRQLEQRLGLPVIADWSFSKKLPHNGQSPGLSHYLGGNRHKAIQISAPELNGIGESVAKKVAVAAAQNGRQTLLILVKRGESFEHIQASEFANLFLLELDPGSVRDPVRFNAGLEKLKGHFDNIFIEAGECEDPDLVNYLAGLADQNVVVVGKGKSRKQVIEDRVVRCSRPGSPPVALIMVNPDRR